MIPAIALSATHARGCAPQHGNAPRLTGHAELRLWQRTSMSPENLYELLQRRAHRLVRVFPSSGIRASLVYDVGAHAFRVLIQNAFDGTVVTILTHEQAIAHDWADSLRTIHWKDLWALARESGEWLISFDRRPTGEIVESRMNGQALLVNLREPNARPVHVKLGKFVREELTIPDGTRLVACREPSREGALRAAIHSAREKAGPSYKVIAVTLYDKSGWRHPFAPISGIPVVDREDLVRWRRWRSDAAPSWQRELAASDGHSTIGGDENERA